MHFAGDRSPIRWTSHDPPEPDSSSVHTNESSFVSPPRSPEEERLDELSDVLFRHSGWQTRRLRIYDILSSVSGNPNRLHRFAACGARAWVQRTVNPPHTYRVISNRCRDRWCEPCQRERRLKIALNLAHRLPPGRVRFVTLTLRSSADTIGEHLHRLISCFRKLRQSRKLAGCFRGGAWFAEFTVSERSGLVHPHLHILTTGDFIPHQVLRSEWLRLTGDSYITDVRELRRPADAAGYVAKYAGKLLSSQIMRTPELLQQAVIAFESARGWSVYGNWRGMKLSESTPDDRAWEYLCPLQSLIRLADEGDEQARSIIAALHGTAAALAAPDDPNDSS